MRSPPLLLSEAERLSLIALTRTRPRTRGIALRARIVLCCATGQANTAVASEIGVSLHTVGKWRHRYLEAGCEGLKDQPRPGKPRRLEWDSLAALIERTLASPPSGGERWTVRKIASAIGVPPATVARIWRYARSRRFQSIREAAPSVEATEREPQPLPVASVTNPANALPNDTTAAH